MALAEGVAPKGNPVQCAGGPASGRAQAVAQVNNVTHCHTPFSRPGDQGLSQQLPPSSSAGWSSPDRDGCCQSGRHCPAVLRMPLLLTGRGFRRDLERSGALALYVPLEGGSETRLLRRLRAAGYRAQMTSARGLGDLEAFLYQSHGIRPPHLGHQSVGRSAAVGEVQRVMPQLGALLESPQPMLLWLLEGQVLSAAERASLVELTQRDGRLKVVVEMGGARALRWQPLDQVAA